MLKEAIEKIQQLSKGQIFEVNGNSYSDVPLYSISDNEDLPYDMQLYSLDAVIDMIKHEAGAHFDGKIFVNVIAPTEVKVFLEYDKKFRHTFIYSVYFDNPDLPLDHWNQKEELIIALKSLFVHTEDVDYLLDLMSRISEESKVENIDNGVGQTIEAKRGIALKSTEPLKERVTLKPFRTFSEIEQPESEFIFRAREKAEFLLKNADGGAWKLEAKKYIKIYLENGLKGLNDVHVIA